MRTLVRTNASLVWFALCSLTVLSWSMGTNHGFGAGHEATAIAIFVVAVFKVRLVGLYFMELKAAPALLRGLFEVYCAALLALLISMFLFG